MNTDLMVLSYLQDRKAKSYEYAHNNEYALEHYYNSFDIIRKFKNNAEIQHIDLNLIKCSYNNGQYQKMTTFCKNLIEFAKKYKHYDDYSGEFLVQVYCYMAMGYQMMGSAQF